MYMKKTKGCNANKKKKENLKLWEIFMGPFIKKNWETRLKGVEIVYNGRNSIDFWFWSKMLW